MNNKNQSRARFRAERRKLAKERKHFCTHVVSLQEVTFFYDGEYFAFGYDKITRRVYRKTEVQRYPYLSPEAAAFLFDEAEELFQAQWRAVVQGNKNEPKKIRPPSPQLELPLFS